ncbi:MAG: hypothetical protein ACLRSD_16445 [Oscillibacter sp.]
MCRGGRQYQNGTGEETQWQSNANSRPAWLTVYCSGGCRAKKDEDGGKIVQRGTHDELIQEDGIYADFVGGKKETAGWKLKKGKRARRGLTSPRSLV